MKPIKFTLAPTLVIENPQSLEELVLDSVGNNNMVQHLKFNTLSEVSAYRVQKAHLEREDKVYIFNKETLELAYIPKVGVDAMTLLLSTKGISVIETLEANSVI